MDFAYTDAQLTLRESLEAFAGAHLSSETSTDLPRLWQSCAERGLHGLTVAAAFGGSGVDHQTVVVAFEALASGGANEELCNKMALHAGCAYAIEQWGSGEQKQTYLPLLANGTLVGTYVKGREPKVDGTAAAAVVHPLPGSALSVVVATASEVTGVDVADGVVLFDLRPIDSAPDSVARVTRLEECISICIAGCRVGKYQRLFGTVQSAAKRFSQKRKLAGEPSELEQSLYHRVADLKVQLDAVQLLVYGAARGFDLSESPLSSSALAHIMMASSMKSLALQALQELCDRSALPIETIRELQAEVAVSHAESDLVAAPRKVVAGSLWD